AGLTLIFTSVTLKGFFAGGFTISDEYGFGVGVGLLPFPPQPARLSTRNKSRQTRKKAFRATRFHFSIRFLLEYYLKSGPSKRVLDSPLPYHGMGRAKVLQVTFTQRKKQ